MDNFHHQKETSASKIQGRFLNLLCFEGFLSKKFVFCSITNSTPFHAKQKIDAKSSPGNVMFKYSAAFGFPSLTSRWVVKLDGMPGGDELSESA